MPFRSRFFLLALAVLTLSTAPIPALSSGNVKTYRTSPASGPTPQTKPPYSSYRNVSIGMKTEDVRKALGEPKDKSDAEDFYLFGESESMQVVYDTGHSVTAISVTLFNDLSKAPTAKDVVGENVPPNADGAIFKMVRYPKAGYWVSYSKTAGDAPTVSITLQKI